MGFEPTNRGFAIRPGDEENAPHAPQSPILGDSGDGVAPIMAPTGRDDAGLDEISEAWDDLDEATRRAVLAIVRAAGGGR